MASKECDDIHSENVSPALSYSLYMVLSVVDDILHYCTYFLLMMLSFS